jgi:hypothetical protein
MKPEIKEKWLEALRSGEYHQSKNGLYDGVGYCCLGVLCDIHSKETNIQWNPDPNVNGFYRYMGDCATLPTALVEWAGLPDDNPDVVVDDSSTSLSELNDSYDYTFTAIADLIEEQL